VFLVRALESTISAMNVAVTVTVTIGTAVPVAEDVPEMPWAVVLSVPLPTEVMVLVDDTRASTVTCALV